MSKKSHQRELERAKAKRQADAYARKQKRTRFVAMALVLALGGAVLVGAALSGGGEDPVVEPTTPTAAENPCPPATDAPSSALLSYDAAPEMSIDPAASYTATIETTCGTIEIALDADAAPVTVNNFVFLARAGYYAGSPFHRVIQDFMIQGGDPSGTGHGEGGLYPGYTIDEETALAEEIVATAGGYTRGLIAMAKTAAPSSTGSQFFIMQVADRPAYPLDPSYTVFGEVTSGMDVVDRIVQAPAQGGIVLPGEETVILSVTINES